MQGGTFSISSLGGIGGTAFTPIINAPEVAILGVSKAAMKPVWNGKEFAPRLMLPLSLSYDHRVIDGALGRALHRVPRAGDRRHAPRHALGPHGHVEIKVPDIGDFKDIPVIEVLRQARRRRREGRPARHARERQGDDGGAVARGRAPSRRCKRQDGRQGVARAR